MVSIELQPSTRARLCVFIIFFFYSFAFPLQQVCNHQDQSSLLAFSAKISTPFSPLNWSYAISCCQWEGISCDANGRVTHLELPSRGLNGAINSSIVNLVRLTHLNLSNNDLHGLLEHGIFGLTNLRIMDLSSNRIFGPIPQEIGNLLSLERLYLQHNSLNGPIPPSLMKCANLVDIVLRDNRLYGGISKLDFSSLVQLQKLDLLNNSLNGTLPESIYSCKSLIAIRVGLNNLTGQISPKIVELKSLSFLSLASNSFTNITRTLRILADCTNLTALFIGHNFYGETLPSGKNFLSLGGFPKLEYFSFDGCNLTGFIPYWLSNLKTLRLLKFDNNKITGKIPKFIGTLPNLISLTLTENFLFGEIPQELCQLPALVSENIDPTLKLFHFELPVFYIKFGRYMQYTTIPTTLFLSNNKLSGHIPSEMGKLQNLQRLSLQNNYFSGHIPDSISNLKILESLDLSGNNLTGGIPALLESLHFLSFLNVSYNDLQGPIPTGGQLSTFGESSFEGNPGLCGELLHHHCSNKAKAEAKDQPPEGGSDSKQSFLDGLVVGFASGFSGVLVIVGPYIWYKILLQRGFYCSCLDMAS